MYAYIASMFIVKQDNCGEGASLVQGRKNLKPCMPLTPQGLKKGINRWAQNPIFRLIFVKLTRIVLILNSATDQRGVKRGIAEVKSLHRKGLD